MASNRNCRGRGFLQDSKLTIDGCQTPVDCQSSTEPKHGQGQRAQKLRGKALWTLPGFPDVAQLLPPLSTPHIMHLKCQLWEHAAELYTCAANCFSSSNLSAFCTSRTEPATCEVGSVRLNQRGTRDLRRGEAQPWPLPNSAAVSPSSSPSPVQKKRNCNKNKNEIAKRKIKGRIN